MKIIMLSSDAILIMILRYFMPVIGAYVTMKSAPSRMDKRYVQVFE